MVAVGCRRRWSMSVELSHSGPSKLVAMLEVGHRLVEGSTDVIVVDDPGVLDDDVQRREGREQLGDYDVGGARIGDVQYNRRAVR